MLKKEFGAAGDEVVVEELYVFPKRLLPASVLLLELQDVSYTRCKPRARMLTQESSLVSKERSYRSSLSATASKYFRSLFFRFRAPDRHHVSRAEPRQVLGASRIRFTLHARWR